MFRLESSNSSEWLEITGLSEPDWVYVNRNVPRPSNGNQYGASSHNQNRRIRGSNCLEAGAGPYYPWEYVKDGGHTFVNQMDSAWDQVGYVHFASRASQEYPLTASFANLHSAITNSEEPTEGIYGQTTNIAHGFYLGNQELVRIVPNLDAREGAADPLDPEAAGASLSAEDDATLNAQPLGDTASFEEAISVTLALLPEEAAKVAIIDALKDDQGQYRILVRQTGDREILTGKTSWSFEDLFEPIGQ